VRYEIHAQPLTLYACHCTDCQKQSSSAFGMSMPVPREAVVISGELKEWRKVGDSGREVACQFCPQCGTRVFHRPARNPAVINVKPGSLDDTSWLRPVGHLWTGSAQPWLVCDPAMLVYDHQPQDFQPLFERWQLHHPKRD
jgi:hypothetical protein